MGSKYIHQRNDCGLPELNNAKKRFANACGLPLDLLPCTLASTRFLTFAIVLLIAEIKQTYVGWPSIAPSLITELCDTEGGGVRSCNSP